MSDDEVTAPAAVVTVVEVGVWFASDVGVSGEEVLSPLDIPSPLAFTSGLSSRPTLSTELADG